MSNNDVEKSPEEIHTERTIVSPDGHYSAYTDLGRPINPIPQSKYSPENRKFTKDKKRKKP